MRYEKYDAYSDSGVEWLGEIPESWGIKKIGQCFEQRKEKVSDKDFEPLSVTMKGIVPRLESAAKTTAGDDRKKVCKGDFVINSRSDRKGSSGVSPLDGSVSLISIILKPIKHEGAYIHHLLRSYEFQEEFYRYGRGIVDDLWTTRYTEMKNIFLPLPPKSEQKAIADFIDKKTSEIDTHIVKQERLIELLKERRSAIINSAVTRGLNENVKFKDSEIEWLGEIPEHWEVKKIKHLSLVKRGSSPRPIDDPRYFDDEGEFAWVRIADVSKNSKYLLHTTQRLSKLGASKSTKIYPQQIFLSIAGTVGKPMISKIKCCIHDGFVWFDKLSTKINIDFLYYIFLNGEAYKGLGKLGTQLNLNTDTVGMISIPLPTDEEQMQIVNFIKKEDDKFYNLLTAVQKEIAYLKEYRKSFISNAVTGKIKVI